MKILYCEEPEHRALRLLAAAKGSTLKAETKKAITDHIKRETKNDRIGNQTAA